jgi:DNA-binding transcriptional LysR family regulator
MLDSRHPLAGSSALRLQDLVEETFLHVRYYGAETHRPWMQVIFRKARFTPRFGAAAMNIDNLMSMVAAGEGVALIPKIVQRGPTSGCTSVPIAEKDLCYELLAVSNPHFSSGLVERFLEIVTTEAAVIEMQLQETDAPLPKSPAAKRKKKAGPVTKVAKNSHVQLPKKTRTI